MNGSPKSLARFHRVFPSFPFLTLSNFEDWNITTKYIKRKKIFIFSSYNHSSITPPVQICLWELRYQSLSSSDKSLGTPPCRNRCNLLGQFATAIRFQSQQEACYRWRRIVEDSPWRNTLSFAFVGHRRQHHTAFHLKVSHYGVVPQWQRAQRYFSTLSEYLQGSGSVYGDFAGTIGRIHLDIWPSWAAKLNCIR